MVVEDTVETIDGRSGETRSILRESSVYRVTTCDEVALA